MGVESFGQNPAVLAIDPRAALAEQLPVAAGMGPDLGQSSRSALAKCVAGIDRSAILDK